MQCGVFCFADRRAKEANIAMWAFVFADKRTKNANNAMWGFVFADRRAKDAKIADIFPTIRGPGKTQKTKNNKKTKRKTKQNEKQNKHKNEKHQKNNKKKNEKRQEPHEHHEPIGLDSNQHLTNDNSQQLTTAALVGSNNCNLMANVGKCASKKTAKLQQCCATFTAKGSPPQTTINNCSNC